MRSISQIRQDHKPIIFLGSCNSIQNIIEICHASGREVVGVIDPDYDLCTEFRGLPILNKETYLTQSDVYEFFVAAMRTPFKDPVFTRNNSKREMLLSWITEYNLTGATLIHPTAVISPTAKIDNHVSIGAMSIVSCGSTIHKNVTVREQCYISHDVEICENSIIQIKATITGSVKIGKNSYIGIASTIVNRLPLTPQCLGENVLVHPTVLVLEGLPDNAIAKLPKRT
jgi:bifunctional N-acetylglucosamine-1-phosphate-uridyltransferase/glucosamine-1-phosphate-acetyltransferase GlmU-like protein